jgi:hypothetical protein
MSGSRLTGLALDPNGNVWISGNTSSPDFPGLNNTGSNNLDFALELNANASALQNIFALIPGTVTLPPVFDSNGNLALAASAGNILRLNSATALSAPAVFALTNSAVPRMTVGLARGELTTIYGAGLGPTTAQPRVDQWNIFFFQRFEGEIAIPNRIHCPIIALETTLARHATIVAVAKIALVVRMKLTE